MKCVSRVIFVFAVLALGSSGCSDGGASGPQQGVATIGFAPKPVIIPYLNLARARAQLDRLQLLGNAPPPPPPGSQPPPGGHPPPDGGTRPPPVSVDLDALSNDSSATLASLPQGLYSRVRFLIGRTSLEGTWKGTVFHVSLAPFGTVVDIPASQPQELGLGQDLSFEVAVDPNIWFPPYLFDGAMLDNRGEIICDDVSNPQIAGALLQGMARSFSLP